MVCNVASPKTNNNLISVFLGGAAGLCDALLLHPFDTLKVRQQLSGLSLLQEVRSTLNGGPLSFYRGIGIHSYTLCGVLGNHF